MSSQTFDVAHAAYNAANTRFELTHHVTGYRLDGHLSAHQISLEGLGGGTWTVEVLTPTDTNWRVYNDGGGAGLDESAVVDLEDIRVRAIRVNLILGGGAAPVCGLTSEPRRGRV